MRKNFTKNMLTKGMAVMMAAGCMIGGAQAVHAEEEHLKIGLGVPFLESDYFIDLNNDLQALAEADGNEVKVYVFDGDFSKQVNQMEDMAADGCNAIINYATTDAIHDTARRLKAEGITIVLFDTAYDETTVDCADYFLGYDNYDMGHMVAEIAAPWIEETFPDAEDGSIELAVIGTTFTPDGKRNMDGMIAVEELTPKAKVVETYDMGTSSDISLVQSYANQAVTAHPNLRGFLCYMDNWGAAANQEIINLPNVDVSQYGVFTQNVSQETYELIEECAKGEPTSVMRGTVSNQFGMAEDAYKGCKKELEADDLHGVSMRLDAVTCENIEDYIGD